MRDIKESLNEIQDITPYLKGEEQIDEGLKDVLSAVKAKFQKAWQWLKGLVVKVGSYILPVTEEGIVMPAITPLTAGQAMADGKIDKSNTAILLKKEAAKITGCKMGDKDAFSLYGSGDSRAYWLRMIKECEDLIGGEMLFEARLANADAEAEYNVIADDTDLKNTIKMFIQNPKLPRLLIWGAPGIGKTAILMNILDEFHATKGLEDYQLIVKTLSNETPDNFVLPDYARNTNDEDWDELAKKLGKEPSAIAKLMKKAGLDRATDIPKTWLPVYKPTGDRALDAELDSRCGKGMLFIDELSRATPQVLNVILPLVNEGLFNGYRLGSGWTIITASNRMEDEAVRSSQTDLGTALTNRFAHVYYEPTVKTWRKWADSQNFMSPVLLSWLSMADNENFSGSKFYYMDPNEDLAEEGGYTKLICTPRSWTNAMRTLATFSHTGTLEGYTIFDIPETIITRVLNMYVPKTAINVFMDFLKVLKSVGDFDRAVHDVWNNGGKGLKIAKKDLNKIAIPLSQIICSAHTNKFPTQKEWESLCTWVADQGSDSLASYVLDVFGNIFLADIDPTLRGQFYTMRERVRRVNGDKTKLKVFMLLTQQWEKRWGIKFDDIPDYLGGIKILTAKYGESFNNAVIGAHENALS